MAKCKILNCFNQPIGFAESNRLFETINYSAYCLEHAKERQKQDKINEELDRQEKAEELLKDSEVEE